MEDKNQHWKIVKIDKNEAPTWTIYARKIDDTGSLEYKIEGEVQSTTEACLASFREDIQDLANGSDKKKYPSYEIVEETKDSLLTYVIHKDPFIFKNTEMRVKYLFIAKEDGNIGVSWHESWEDCPNPPSKKLKRIEFFRGNWHFEKIANNQTKAENSVQFNPKKMPRWLFEPMVTKFLKAGLEGIRNKTAKETLLK